MGIRFACIAATRSVVLQAFPSRGIEPVTRHNAHENARPRAGLATVRHCPATAWGGQAET